MGGGAHLAQLLRAVIADAHFAHEALARAPRQAAHLRPLLRSEHSSQGQQYYTWHGCSLCSTGYNLVICMPCVTLCAPAPTPAAARSAPRSSAAGRWRAPPAAAAAASPCRRASQLVRRARACRGAAAARRAQRPRTAAHVTGPRAAQHTQNGAPARGSHVPGRHAPGVPRELGGNVHSAAGGGAAALAREAP